MKPAPFAYLAVASVEEATQALGEHGADSRVMAGGQSLGPLLNLRLARPAMVLDINRVMALGHITIGPAGDLIIGAMARQRAVETDPHVRAGWPVLVEAIGQIGHRAIRHRGTVGGSVSHADPAAELPAVLVALDARFTIASRAGHREMAASEFFRGPFETALAPDELLESVIVPPVAPRTRQAWLEYARRHGDFGLIGVAAVVQVTDGGIIERSRLVLSGADGRPWEPPGAPDMLVGNRPDTELFTQVGGAAAAESDPPFDIHASSAHRRRLIASLTTRALERCVGPSGGGAG